MKHRACRALLCLVLAASLLLPMTVGALAGSTTIGTDASRPEYFEALGASGNYNPLKTPYHYDKTTGNVAYCLEHKKDSPSSSAEYTDFDASALWGQNTVTGIQAIVDHGYPNSCGGLSEEQAHYATANAIRAWMKESADVGYEFMRVDKGHVRPLSGTAAQRTWAFFLELLGYARAGDVLSGGGGTVRVSPREAVWTVDGDVLRTRIEVVSSDGYALSRSHSQVSVSGYTGGTYDVLDVTAPASLLGQTVQLIFEAAAGAGNGVTLYWCEPVSASSQSVAVVRLGGGSGVGETRTVSITGPQLVSLTVIKRDGSTGAALDGAVFALADASGNPVGLTQTGAGRYTAGGSAAQFTTSGGTAVIEGLTAGSYTLTEVSPPSPGYAAIAPETLQLTASGTATIDNVPTEVNVTKQDGLTGERLAGMQFSLLDGKGERVTLTRGADGVYRPDAQGGAYFVTDENGQARILGLPQGSYAIAESAHEGYAALDASPRFELMVRADVTITNEPLTLEITKADGYTGEGMSGVEFSLRDADGNAVPIRSIAEGVYYYSASAQGDALVTGADGKATVYYLPVGVYMLEEEMQDGYVQTEPVQVTVSAESGLSDPVRVRFVNDPTVLILTKSDAATREPLDGATFRLVDASGKAMNLEQQSSGNYRPALDGQETFTTEKGEVCIRYLPCGSYTVEEVSAPEGYTKESPRQFVISGENGAANPVRIAMQDMPLALEFRKVDAESGAALDGCVFSLKGADGNVLKLRMASDGVYVPDTSGKTTFTTVDGKAVIVQINPGTYRIEEVTAAEGYALAEDVIVTVTDASTSAAPATVAMQDEMLALRITKVDVDTRQTLGGAVFNVKGENGELLGFAPVLGRADTFEVVVNGSENLTIPKSGSVTLLKMPVGVYEVVETRAPAGYAISKEAETVTVGNENTVECPAQIVIEDCALAVQVTKTDGLTGERLAGVRFRVELLTGVALRVRTVSEGRFRVDEVGDMGFATGPDGIATLIGIPEGTYRLVEENNPGFGRVEPVEFTVTAESTLDAPTVIGVENQPLALEITKVDAQTLEPLEGVSFRLADGKGNMLKFMRQVDGVYHPDESGVETVTTDAEGKLRIRYIPAGAYLLTEEEFSGYSMGKPLEIVVRNENTVSNPCAVTVENRPIAMEITKTDLLTGAVMEGVAFEILDKDGKAVTFERQESGVYIPAKEGRTGSSELVSDEGGVVRIEYLPQGSYTLKEQQVTGYAALEPIAFTLTNEHTQEEPLQLNVRNLPTRLRIEKQDSVTQEALAGATFRIADKDGKVIPLVRQKDGTYHPAGKEEKGITEIPVDDEGCIVIDYLPAGAYTVTETASPTGYGIAQPVDTEVGTETIRQTVEGAWGGESGESLLGETRLAVLDHPLALRIRKIHSVTKQPLAGAEFQLKADGDLNTPLRYTEKDGVFWYDPKGVVTTITLNSDCEALVYGLPEGRVYLEESKVPDGYFPIAPVACTITLEHTSEAPLEVTVANTPAVKLGLDTDRYNVAIAVGSALVLLSGLGAVWLSRRGKRKNG